MFFFTATAQQRVDSLQGVVKRPTADSIWHTFSGTLVTSAGFVKQVLAHHPYFGFSSAISQKPVSMVRKVVGKEKLFYLLLFLVVIFGLLRQLFPKYFGDLFRLFFRTTLKQKQIREQLLQTPLPSMALNIFFVIASALYVTFVVQHFKWIEPQNFWHTLLYAGLALLAIYTAKYIGIQFSGWLFDMKEAANAYVFIVFVVNKMMGIFLLLVLPILAFSKGHMHTIGLVISWCVLAALYLYRITLTYSATRSQIKVNPFHFFLYLLAFEIAPLLIIYKGLLLYFV